MRFSEGDKVLGKANGRKGIIQEVEYTFQVKAGEYTERHRYLVLWEESFVGSWTDEDKIESREEKLEVSKETEIGLLRILIDRCMKQKDEKGFMEYTKELKQLL